MEQTFSADQRRQLLAVARQAIDSRIRQGKALFDTPADIDLHRSHGCFVTIKKNGHLRGCIGNFLTDLPLYREVADMAVAAATKDPRFYPMGLDDLNGFSLEISVLSPLQRIEKTDEIAIGLHGLYLEKGFARGVLLPQVATEYGWDRETFLQQVCIKAGLDPEEWRSPETVLYRFSAQVFGEANPD